MNRSDDFHTDQEFRLLTLLSKRYPTIQSAHIEMINLHAILGLPKGTDHYISDIHGSYAQFDHILRHASGAIRRKIEQTFATELSERDQTALERLIYYPEHELRGMPPQAERGAWQALTITHLLRVVRTASEKYTRNKVRKRLPAAWRYSLDELLFETNPEKARYYENSIQAMIALGEGDNMIVVLATLIQSLVVDRLYIVGDIFDRGPAAEQVMDRLMAHHAVMIQWGNHDIAWMGAAAGSEALICTVLRMALRYGTLDTVQDGYGIPLNRLTQYADTLLGDDPCPLFHPRTSLTQEDYSHEQIARMHKVMTTLQLKLEAQVIRRHPEYDMDDRLVLDALDLAHGTVTRDGVTYPLRDTDWPTLLAPDRAALTAEEATLVADLRYQFMHSARLQTHIRFLYSYGSMFSVRDGHLLFHGCLPVDEAGAFVAVPLGGQYLAGPALLQRYEQVAREAFFSQVPAVRQAGQDAIWYLWCGPHSPLFGKQRMATFERYFIADPATHAEPKSPYYVLRDDEAFCRGVLAAFGADPEYGRIINGHTPVKKGRSPLLANGKLIVIDGGMSTAYQDVTGIAGYTLIYNSHEMVLAAHAPFAPDEESPHAAQGTLLSTTPIARAAERVLIAATDTGRVLQAQLDDLHKLVDAYRRGLLVEGASNGAA